MAGPFSRSDSLRACFKTTRGAIFGEKAGWQGATQETALRGSAPPCFGKLNRRAWEAHTPGGSSTEEQRRQPAFSPKTLRAAGLLAVAGVGPVVTARCGAAPTSPPWPQPKSPVAAPLVVLKQALSHYLRNIHAA